MYTFLRVRRHGAIGLVMLAVTALTLAPSAQAQRAFDDKDVLWWNNLEVQLTASLNSPVEQVRDTALRHVIFFANHYGDNVDFRDASGKILFIYANDPHEGRRTMALSALHAIGDRHTMEQLSRLLQEEPAGRIHQLTLAVLTDYYKRHTI